MQSTSDVRDMMNARFADGTAYPTTLPFDIRRGDSIRAATLALAEGRRDQVYLTLDVGSGQGGIASFWTHSNIVGLEISEVAVKMAREAFGHKGVKYICGAIEDFEIGAGQKPFDVVVAQESIEHWTDTSKGLDRISASMKPRGTLIITTPNRDSLHCRISRKLGLGEPPYCSIDHIHEFGYLELIHHVEEHGFECIRSLGVGLLPYWTMEKEFGVRIRSLTDADPEVVEWFETLGHFVPPSMAFIQCHSFEKL